MVTTAGAETLPFLASLGVLPASVAFFMFYGRCVERLKPDNVFYVAILPLVLFYAFFASVLYPAAGVLHPHGFYEALAPVLPVGLHGLLKVPSFSQLALIPLACLTSCKFPIGV